MPRTRPAWAPSGGTSDTSGCRFGFQNGRRNGVVQGRLRRFFLVLWKKSWSKAKRLFIDVPAPKPAPLVEVFQILIFPMGNHGPSSKQQVPINPTPWVQGEFEKHRKRVVLTEAFRVPRSSKDFVCFNFNFVGSWT